MDEICKEIRRMTVECIGSIGSGHIGGSMSMVELMKVLYFDKMNRLVVSKGHAGPVVYATLALKAFSRGNGFILSTSSELISRATAI